MKRILRSFLTLLMLVVWASGFAADKTYSYTFKSGGSFTADKQTKTFGGVNWTITSDGSGQTHQNYSDKNCNISNCKTLIINVLDLLILDIFRIFIV